MIKDNRKYSDNTCFSSFFDLAKKNPQIAYIYIYIYIYIWLNITDQTLIVCLFYLCVSPKVKRLIRRFERIWDRICRHEMPDSTNKQTHRQTHTHKRICIYIYIYIYIYIRFVAGKSWIHQTIIRRIDDEKHSLGPKQHLIPISSSDGGFVGCTVFF